MHSVFTIKVRVGLRRFETWIGRWTRLRGGSPARQKTDWRRPAYLNVGNGPGFAPNHPGHAFEDAAIPYGAWLYARVVEMALGGYAEAGQGSEWIDSVESSPW